MICSAAFRASCDDPIRHLNGCRAGYPEYPRGFALDYGLLRALAYQCRAKKRQYLYPDTVLPDHRGRVRWFLRYEPYVIALSEDGSKNSSHLCLAHAATRQQSF